MDKCITCADNLSSEDIGWCNRCAQFAPLLVGAGFEGRPSLVARQTINAVLSPNRRRTAHPRWRAILEEFDDGESDWAFQSTQVAQNENDPWFVTEEKRERQLKKLRNSLCIPNRDDDDGEKMLQKGIPLPDGSHLSMISDIWAIDGRILPGSVPINHLLRSLTGNSKEMKRFENCDWKSLLTTLLIVANRRVDRNNVRGNYQNRQMNRMQRILLRREHPPGRALFEGADLFLRWNNGMNRLAAQAFGGIPHNVGGVFGQMVNEIREIRGEEVWSDIDWDLLQSNNQLWVKRWREVMDAGTPLAAMRSWAGPSLRIHLGKLQIRTIKNGKWIWSQIPPWPRLWALLASWALSPPSSDEHQHLRALQWCWHENCGELVPAEPERRALLLLRGICESDKRITVSTQGNFHITIEGTSGLFYTVGPGPGAHGARFTVTGAESLEDLEKGRCLPLCIHEDGQFKQLPVGDVISSVILTLMDDLISAEKLEPLAKFISDNGLRSPLQRGNIIGPRNPDDPAWLEHHRHDYRLGRGRHRGRWLNIFPAAFRVMINTPIGGAIRIPMATPNAVTIDDTMVAWVVRDQDELDLVRGLARLAGFRRREEQRGDEFEVFERAHVRVQGVRRELVEMLGPYERRHGRPGEPPWWNLFPNPIAPDQLLDRLPNRLNIPIEDGIGYHH